MCTRIFLIIRQWVGGVFKWVCNMYNLMHVQWECQINQWVYQLWVYGITYRFSLIPCVSHPKHEWNLFWDVNNSLFGGGYPPSRGLTPRNEVLGKCRRRFPHVDHALVEFLHTKSWYLWMLPFIPPDFFRRVS